MSFDPFIHLHLHTEYSLLDGAVRIKQLMEKAARCKMPAVAMTDHGNLFGAIDFYKEATQAGIKPILGCEVYLTPPGMGMTEHNPDPKKRKNSHLTLLAQNNKGWHNLVKLVTKAHLDGFYYKPRIDKELLAEHSEGLICLSGCINGEINQLTQQEQMDAARKSLGEFIDIFGRENYFLEIHDHGLEQQHVCTRQMIKFGKEFDLGLVAANDVHFLERKDYEAHDVMVCIGSGSLQSDEGRMRYSPEVYFKTTREMTALFKDVPEAIRNTVAIADRCEVSMLLDSTSSEKYPRFYQPGEASREDYFHKLCIEGLRARYGDRADTDEELKARLDYEIGVIQDMGFVSYFLITWDLIKWVSDNEIPVGPGRGSAAGSLVNYVLGITDICPLRFGLLFERFLNPERVSPPDIDIDFCQVRRDEVIEYLRRKYGERAVSHIVTFGTLGAKSVIRDVARAMGLSCSTGDRLAGMIPNELNITLKKAKKKNPELKEVLETEPTSKQVWDYAKSLEGLTRGIGIHAAGIIIGDRDLSEYIPLTRGKEGELVTQYAMGPLDQLGLMKMDFLGLKTLTVIADAVELIRNEEPDFQLETTELNDKATFDLFGRGETVGVFQMESGAMSDLCKRFGADRIEDIIALIALYRPGSIHLIPDYIERKKGKQKAAYPHPLLEEVLSETYGIMIYQEQLLQAANVLAGFSLDTADLMRRVMRKKNASSMRHSRKLFVEGCAQTNQITGKKAKKLFDWLESSASHGFCKAHSTAYGLISYQTAYLKANYPIEFMTAWLRNENWDYKCAVVVEEAERMGISLDYWRNGKEGEVYAEWIQNEEEYLSYTLMATETAQTPEHQSSTSSPASDSLRAFPKPSKSGPDDVFKSLPVREDAERAVLSCMLKSQRDKISDAQEILNPEFFYILAHRKIYETLSALFDEFGKVDLITLTEELDRKKILDEVGGRSKVAALLVDVPTIAFFDHYAAILKDNFILRKITETTSDITATLLAKIKLHHHDVQLSKPIKTTGSFEVPLKIHSDIEVTLAVKVVAPETKTESAEKED